MGHLTNLIVVYAYIYVQKLITMEYENILSMFFIRCLESNLFVSNSVRKIFKENFFDGQMVKLYFLSYFFHTEK